MTKKKENPQKAGRKPIETTPLSTEQQIEKLASINCSWAEIESVMGFTRQTICNNPKFLQAYKKGKESGKAALKRIMWESATVSKSVPMQIFLSKNLLNYSDKTTVVDPKRKSLNELLEEAKQLTEELESENNNQES